MSEQVPWPVIEARRWIGTPYVHQASVRLAGCDCLGLIRGVWRARLGAEPAGVPAYTWDWAEPQGDERLWRAAARYLRSKSLTDACAGDVVLFRMRPGAVAKHLGILSTQRDGPAFIHAYSGRGVVESPMSIPWQRRVVACFAFPEGA